MAFLSDLWKKGTSEPLVDDIPEGGLAVDVEHQKVFSRDNKNAIFEIGARGIPEPTTQNVIHGRIVDGSNVGDWIPTIKKSGDTMTGALGVVQILRVHGNSTASGSVQTHRADGTEATSLHFSNSSSHGLGGNNFYKFKLFPLGGGAFEADMELSTAGLYVNGIKLVTQTELDTHIGEDNPHGITPGTIGLANVSDLDPANQVKEGLPDADETSAIIKMDDDTVLTAPLKNYSSGAADANSVPILNAAGQIDASMLDTSIFYLVGAHDPSDGVEYPDTTGETHGAFWFVNALANPENPPCGPGEAERCKYTFTGGDLAGKTISTWDFMVWAANGWSIMSGQMNPALYVRRDGSLPMVGDLQLGSSITQYKVKWLKAGGTCESGETGCEFDAINYGQLETHRGNGDGDTVQHVSLTQIGDWDSKAPGSHDHTNLLDLAGTRAMTGNLQMGSKKIVGLAAAGSSGEAIIYEQIAIGTY